MVAMAVKEMDGTMSTQWLAKDVLYLQKMREEKQVKFREFPAKVLVHLAKTSEEIKQDLANSDPQVKKVFNSYSKFHSMYLEHQRITRRSYYKHFS